MELIRRLSRRLSKNGKRLESWGLYQCPNPVCYKQVERRLGSGERDKSCGCLHWDKTHGYKETRLYNVWASIKQRILNTKNKDYKDYGGRGITICNEWLEYSPFRDWSLNNGYMKGLEIHRENDGNYEPNSCKWVTRTENMRDTREVKLTLEKANEIRALYNTGYYTRKQLAEKYDVSRSTISFIINNKIWKN